MSARNTAVTVIMACHNSAAYLDEAIKSVLGQTLSDLELILIDDCSSDKTLEIAERYRSLDDRLSIIPLPVHSGPAIARNDGILAAKADWIGILDSDDVAMPSRFKEQLRLANSDKRLVQISSNSSSIDNHSHAIKEHRYPVDHKGLIKRLYSLQAFPSHSSMLYRKETVIRSASFNPRYARSQDYDLWLRLSEIGQFASIDQPLVKIRKHAMNISNSDGGVLQRKYGSVATICHFLRILGCPDPSTSNDKATWHNFFTWADSRLVEEGAFSRHDAWTGARSGYFATPNKLSGAFRFGTRLLQSGHTGALVWEKCFGSSLPERLAQEWMGRS